MILFVLVFEKLFNVFVIINVLLLNGCVVIIFIL